MADTSDPSAPEISISQAAAPVAPVVSGAPDLTQGLNPEQKEAVEATQGAVLVLAGAGTGKTRVLTTRLAHILQQKLAWPSQTLTVTFTNKAAREMRQRSASLIGPAAEELRWLGTFHSVSARILRQHAQSAGLKSSDFTILDTDDQLRLCKQVIEAAHLDTKRWAPRFLAGLIDSWKNRALTPDRLPAEESERFANGNGARLYQTYQERLHTLNACDFGDLPLRVIQMLQTCPDILDDFHKRFRYILVDEYQDTNVAQYMWLRILARGSGNICCVGDDDQSIYGWRGAEVDNILRFEKDFPGAKVVRLERNYRSTGHILASASQLITQNQARLGKTLHCEGEQGDKVRVMGLWDDEAEARRVAELIEDRYRDGRPYAECAILVRAAWQMRAFEECFVMQAIPYRVIGGPRFYERAEIRDALAYLRLVNSRDDDLAFERIVNQPRRGIGDASLQKLRQVARESELSLLQAIEPAIVSGQVSGRAKAGLRQFAADLERWTQAQNIENPAPSAHVRLTETILDESGYTGMWQADRSPQGQTKLDNLKELVRVIGEFDSLSVFLEHVQLVMDAAAEAESVDQVQIMTLHSAKGLEWPCVFLPGWEEDVFPSRRSLDESGLRGLEEERRLAHVGLTRARMEACISFVANRRIHGRWQSVLPSRFIDELPPAHVQAESVTGYGAAPPIQGTSSQQYRRGGSDTARHSGGANLAGHTVYKKPYVAEPKPKPRKAQSSGGSAQTGAFPPGQRVEHRAFGIGRVVQSDGMRLTVDFGSAGTRKLMASFVTPIARS